MMCRRGNLIHLNDNTYPNSFLFRSPPHDVARTENATYICSGFDPGPTNNHMDPAQAREIIGGLFHRIMKGRTMYVIPVVLGPKNCRHAPVFVEITDSPYVVLNLHRLYRIISLDEIDHYPAFPMLGLHALGNLDPEKRFILHFPESNEVFSINTGFGGNSILPKKCGLRLGSFAGFQNRWLAEHMAIFSVQDPQGRIMNVGAAFPSSCGKTNMAMMKPTLDGYQVHTISDDLAFCFPGDCFL